MCSTLKKRKKMKTKSLYLIMLCAIFSGCTLPDLPSPPKSTKSKSTTITSSVSNSVSGIKVSKEYQAKCDSAKPRMQEFLSNMACYKANKNDKFMEGGTRTPALRRDDSHLKRASGTCSDNVDILSIENVKFIAKNAFSFSVTFVTADGEEVAKFDDLIFTQHPSGEWLVRW